MSEANSTLSAEFAQDGETKLVRGEKEVQVLAYAFIDRATTSYLYGLADERVPKNSESAIEFMKSLFRQNPTFKLRLIVDLQKENLAYYKAIIGMGAELRHLSGNKVSFAISRDEYLAVPLASIEAQIESNAELPSEIVWSTRRDVISQFEQIFEAMWHSAVRAESRIREIEQGVEPERTVVIDDMRRVYALGNRMSEECKEEALMILASEKTILRNEAMFRKLAQRQRDAGIRVQILTPVLDQAAIDILPDADWKAIENPINVTIMIYDRARMFITQYSNPDAPTTEAAVSTNIYSTSKATIAGIASVFKSLWDEADLRQREEKSRRQAELLQDVLTHDIRNYNQISKMGAEILVDHLNNEKEYQEIASSVVQAIDGSTALVDKAKKLGRVLAEAGNVKLYGVDLIQAIDRSLLTVKKIYSDKEIKETRKVLASRGDGASEFLVLADDLLDDVFVNIFSNSVKFSQDTGVGIEILIDEKTEEEHGRKESWWRVKLRDSGPGIPTEQQENIFERYSKGKKGSGLGLSIVHALVVARYGGKVRIESGVEDSPSTKGTTISLLLKKASP